MKAVLEVYSRLKTVPGPPITKKRNLVWTASNICRGKPNPPYAKVADVMTLFEDVYKNETDLEMLIDASWGLIYIIEASGNFCCYKSSQSLSKIRYGKIRRF